MQVNKEQVGGFSNGDRQECPHADCSYAARRRHSGEEFDRRQRHSCRGRHETGLVSEDQLAARKKFRVRSAGLETSRACSA